MKWRDNLEIFEINGYPDYGVTRNGQILSMKSGRWKPLKPQIDTDGYPQVRLFENNRGRLTFVHRIVAETFMNCPSDCYEVNHIDGNKQNNKLSNLEWCNRAKNMLHAHDNELITTRTPIMATNIKTNETIIFKGQHEAARMLNIGQGNINHALKRNKGTCGGYRFEYLKGDGNNV